MQEVLEVLMHQVGWECGGTTWDTFGADEADSTHLPQGAKRFQGISVTLRPLKKNTTCYRDGAWEHSEGLWGISLCHSAQRQGGQDDAIPTVERGN